MDNLFDLLLSQSEKKRITDIDKLTLDLIGMLELYGETKNLPWQYVEKRGVYNVLQQAKTIEKLDDDFKRWIIKYRMNLHGKQSKCGFSGDVLTMQAQISLAQALNNDTVRSLGQILSFSSADAKRYFETLKEDELPSSTTEWGKPSDADAYFRVRYKDYSSSSAWKYTDWEKMSSGEPWKKTSAWINHSYHEVQTRCQEIYRPKTIPDDMKDFCEKYVMLHYDQYESEKSLQAKKKAEAKYAAEMKKYKKDLEFYEEHKAMLDHPPVEPKMEEPETVIEYAFYFELTGIGKQVYNLITEYTQQVQTNMYNGCNYDESEFVNLEKRPNYRAELDAYIGKTITLRCDSYSVTEEMGHKTLIGRNIRIIDENGQPMMDSEINHMYFFVDENIETFTLPLKLNITGVVKRYKYDEQVNIGLVPQSIWFTIQ